MTQQELAEQLFAQDALLHFDMTEALRRGDGELTAAVSGGALVYLPRSRVYFLSAQDEQAARSLMKFVAPGAHYVVAHQRFLVPLLREYGFEGEAFCCHAVYPAPTPPAAATGCTLRPLGPESLPFVAAHYDLLDMDGLREMLSGGWVLGAEVDGTMVGFVGVHGEGAMGMLEVLPEYRRRGYATVLESALIARFLEAGQTPYAQIFEDNDASLRLQAALGLQCSRADICWCGHEKDAES
jgi:tRNA (guanine37-N1)-methyltransferase